MRKKLVVGNWKMNLVQPQALSLVESLVKKLSATDAVDVAVCPPYTSIAAVVQALKGTQISVGAQNVFWKDSGAFTGCVSAPMLADAGCKLCIVGHSETRGRFGKLEIDADDVGYFAETNRTVNQKIQALLYHSVMPILCVGETLAEREAGQTDSVIQTQLREALQGVDASELGSFSVAYEPVWAIGTGQVCDAKEASRVCGMIRRTLADLYDQQTAEGIRILYGGSVKGSNSKELFSQPDIDGGLVGGASLDPNDFTAIVLSAV
ncbi:MAG: triose-phosphate isomerase [Fimbriimonadales bacterium]|nr:triose-phosphate isomerase [Fimbriimonadales bacterium]